MLKNKNFYYTDRFIMYEKYIYYKKDLVDSAQRIDFPGEIGNKKDAYIQNVIGKLYDPLYEDTKGFIAFTNNTTVVFTDAPDNKPMIERDKMEFTTSIGTIQTQNGKLVINYSYNLKNKEPYLPSDQGVSTQPTYKDGKYAKFKNVKVSVQSFPDGKRILKIHSSNY
jgi:hypothetical protein